jgi:hypothetical protein
MISDQEILLCMRDLFERAEASDAEQEADPKNVALLIAGLRTVIEAASVADAYHAGRATAPKTPRMHDPHTPIAGGWRAVNLTDRYMGADIEPGFRVNLAPGESHLPPSFSGAFADGARGTPSPANADIASGDLVLLPPGAPDTTEWRKKLTPLAWSRRGQAVASRVELLRECVSHLPQGDVNRRNFERLIAQAAPAAKAAE